MAGVRCVPGLVLLLVALALPCSHSGRLSRDKSLGLKARVTHSVKRHTKVMPSGTAMSARPARQLQEIEIESRNCSGIIYACGTSDDVRCTNDCYQLCSAVADLNDPFPEVSICNFPQECVNGTCIVPQATPPAST